MRWGLASARAAALPQEVRWIRKHPPRPEREKARDLELAERGPDSPGGSPRPDKGLPSR